MIQNETEEFAKTIFGIMSLSQCLSDISLKCYGISDEKVQKEIEIAFSEIKEKTKKLYSVVQQNAWDMNFEQRLDNSITTMLNFPMSNYNFWM